MPLHPQSQMFIAQVAAIGAPPTSTLTPEQARASFKAYRMLAGAPEPVARVEDRTIPGSQCDIPVRVYAPAGDGPFPVTMYFHGGGFVIGDLDSHDNVCRSLVNRANCIIVSVDYRMGPEHKFPAAVVDAYDATAWVANHAGEIGGDPGRVAVCGDSAGGNLATVTALQARNRKGPNLKFQALIYPVTDATNSLPSYEENGEGYLLTKDTMQWFIRHYIGEDQDKKHPYLSPLFEKDLSGLPPALVITAEFDPLRDDGVEYAKRLEEAGVPTKHTLYPGMLHGFFSLSSVFSDAAVALDEVAAGLRGAFA